jgi:hypothetical protein
MLKNKIKCKAFINNYLHEFLNKIDQYDRKRFSFHRQAFERLRKLCQQINQFMRWIPKDHMNGYS